MTQSRGFSWKEPTEDTRTGDSRPGWKEQVTTESSPQPEENREKRVGSQPLRGAAVAVHCLLSMLRRARPGPQGSGQSLWKEVGKTPTTITCVGPHSQRSESIAHSPLPGAPTTLCCDCPSDPALAMPCLPSRGPPSPRLSDTSPLRVHIFSVTVCCSWLHLGGLWHSPHVLQDRAEQDSPQCQLKEAQGQPGWRVPLCKGERPQTRIPWTPRSRECSWERSKVSASAKAGGRS